MAWLGFHTLGRLAVLADFSEAPPDRVLASVPTPGMSAIAIAGAAACTVPLFFALPRLHGPFAVAPMYYDRKFKADNKFIGLLVGAGVFFLLGFFSQFEKESGGVALPLPFADIADRSGAQRAQS